MAEPTSLAGYLDDAALSQDVYGSVQDYILEQNPDLLHPVSVRTFAKMRHDPQIAAVLRAYYLAITRARWSVNGDGCRDEVTARIADDLGLPIKGVEPEPSGARRRGFTWDEHLRIALSLSTVFGHAPFAQQWAPEGGGWRLAVVQERMPQTIGSYKLNSDGTLAYAEQNDNGQEGTRIYTANHQLIWYAREREGSNYFGRSLIREAYAPWLMKTDALRRHATAIQRFSMGVPGFEALPGANITPQQELAAQQKLSTLQASARSHMVPPPGYRFTLTGMTGSVPDAPAFITMLDRYITRATLTSILDMATAERGARSLGETVMDLMVYAQQAEANRIAHDATQQIVVPLVDANWGEDEAAPVIECEDVGADVQLTAQDLNWLLQWGGLRPDKPARDWVRDRYGIPDEDPADPVNQAPTPNNNEPQGGH